MGPPWIKCSLESSELLAICLKKIKGLNKAKIIDASFIWTEPHSKRIKVKVTIQKEILGKTTLQSTFVVEFFIQGEQCDDCRKSFTPHTWTAVVQIRQRADNKKTIFYLEQIMLKNRAHEKCLKIKQMPDGMDFYFKDRSSAQALVRFVETYVPTRITNSKELISQDDNSNTHNYKYSFCIEISPISRYDLVIFPRKLQLIVGASTPLMLCLKVSTNMIFLDTRNFKIVSIDKAIFWNHDIQIVSTRKNLSELIVTNIEKSYNIPEQQNKSKIEQTFGFSICEIELQRDKDLGTENIFFARTHIGEFLKIGDKIKGYSINQINSSELEAINQSKLPDVVVVQKYTQKHHKRIFKLKRMSDESNVKTSKKVNPLEEVVLNRKISMKNLYKI